MLILDSSTKNKALLTYILPRKKDNTSLPNGHHSFSLSLTRLVVEIQTKYRPEDQTLSYTESAVIRQHVKILEDTYIHIHTLQTFVFG